MLEYLENEQNVVLNLENENIPKGHLVEDYLTENIPEYAWDSENNLIALIKYSKGAVLSTELFHKFIFEWQQYARYTDSLTEESKAILEELESSKDEDSTTEDFKNFIPNYKKALGTNGIVLDKRFEDKSGNSKWVSCEVLRDSSGEHIQIRTEGKSLLHQKILNEVIHWFKASSRPVRVLAGCNCHRCRKKNITEAYYLDYEILKKLQIMFSPEVQCYESGEMIPLDEVSTVERPTAKVALIYESDDSNYAKEIKKNLKNRLIKTSLWDLNDMLAGQDTEKYLEQLKEHEIVIVLASSDLVANEFILEQLELLATRHKKGEIVMLLIEVRKCHWRETAIFKNCELLNDIPIASSTNQDEAWQIVGEKAYKKIQHWLHNRAIQ